MAAGRITQALQPVVLSQTAFGSFTKLEVQYAIAGRLEMRNQEGEKPIALDAYEALAERYAALVDSKAENAYCERPATLSLLPDVEGKRVLDAGCGPGSYSEWLALSGLRATYFLLRRRVPLMRGFPEGAMIFIPALGA